MNLTSEKAKGIIIRRIKRGEFEQVFKLLSNAFQKEIEIAGLDVCRFRRMARFYSLASGFLFLLDILHIDFETILVAISDGKVVGEIHLVPHGKKIWSINSVAVDMQFRRRGIYRSLMKKALRYVEERRAERIIQTIRIDNATPTKVAKELGFELSEEKNLLRLEIGHVSSPDAKDYALVRTIKRTDIEQVHEICKAVEPKRIDRYKIEPQDFLESFSDRVRNKIAQIRSKKWILVWKGDTLGYTSVTYTSPEEAGNIDSFCILPSEGSSDLAGLLLGHALNFLRAENVRKVIVSLNRDWSEIFEVFRGFGFEHVAFFYEATKELVSGTPHKILT